MVGGHDEMTTEYFKMLGKIGYWKNGDISPDALRNSDTPGSLSGSCSLNMLLADKSNQDTLCKIVGIDMLYEPSVDELCAAAGHLLEKAGIAAGDLSAIVLGLSGDRDNDRVYLDFRKALCPDTPAVWYKHIFGESFCASAFGVLVGATCLHERTIPAHLLYQPEMETTAPKFILVHNHFHNKDHSLILLSSCSC